jgi:hypothetical protein
MNTTETIKKFSAEKKTALCIVMSMFYFAMLAYPFGVTMEGYVWQKAVIAGVIFFAISIPAWIINVKREFYDGAQVEGTVEDMLENELDLTTAAPSKPRTIGELARMQHWLTSDEIAQIRFCQDGEPGSTFGEVAIKRNYLTPKQVETLVAMQEVNG